MDEYIFDDDSRYSSVPPIHWRDSTHNKGHPRHQVLRFDLSENQGGQNGREENGKHAILQRSERVVELQKGETDNKSDGNMGKETGPLVIGVTPERDVGCSSVLSSLPERYTVNYVQLWKRILTTRQDSLELEHEASSVISLSVIGRDATLGAFLVQPLHFSLDILEFGRIPPLFRPVAADTFTRTRTDRLEHVFGDVDIAGDRSAVAFEVRSQNLGIVADIAKVDTLATALKK